MRQGRAPDSFAQVPVERTAQYACEDAEPTLHVRQALWPRLEADEKLRGIYELEMATSDVLFQIERHGVPVGQPNWRRKAMHWASASCNWSKRRTSWPGGAPFQEAPSRSAKSSSTNSACPWSRKPPPASPAPTKRCAEKLAEDYPLPARILEHRGLSKLKGTYTDKLPLMINPGHGPRAHALRAGRRR